MATDDKPTDKPSGNALYADDPSSPVLYFFTFSLYSIMVRFAAVLGSEKHPGQPGPKIVQRHINMHLREHCSEEYLKINPKGQVPCLVPPQSEPLTESLDIAYWLCDAYPELLPETHRETIKALMAELYEFHALPLSLRPENRPKEGELCPSTASEILDAGTVISDQYRAALEWKVEYDLEVYGTMMDRDNLLKAEKQATDFLGKVLSQFEKYNAGGTWIFGDAVGPTVLDGHTVPFISRLLDMKHFHLIPKPLQEYAEKVMSLPSYLSVNHGRSTNYNRTMGKISDFTEF